MNVIDVAPEEAVCVVVAGELTIKYSVIADPPFEAGAVHVTVVFVLFVIAVAIPIVGVPGVVYGVTELEGEE